MMGYLETGMRVLDSASALLSRLQELAVLGANDTNTTADHEAINLEAEAIADEFNRLMTTSTYKGRDIYNDTANGLYVSMGGRDQEMTFGIGRINYTAMYKTDANARTIVGAVGDPASPTVDGPNKGAVFNLAHLPSDAVVAKEYGRAGNRGSLEGATWSNTTYVTKVVSDVEKSWADADNKQAETIGKALFRSTVQLFPVLVVIIMMNITKPVI